MSTFALCRPNFYCLIGVVLCSGVVLLVLNTKASFGWEQPCNDKFGTVVAAAENTIGLDGVVESTPSNDHSQSQLSSAARSVLHSFLFVFGAATPDVVTGIDMLTIPGDGRHHSPLFECLWFYFSPAVPNSLTSPVHAAIAGLRNNIDGDVIPSETSNSACAIQLFATALSLSPALSLQRDAANYLVVEYGTMMGHSTRCIAAGKQVASLLSTRKLEFFAFDTFTYIPSKPFSHSNLSARIKQLEKPEAYKKQVQQNVKPFSVNLVAGWIGKSEGNVGSAKFWGNQHVNMFSVDSSKDEAFFLTQMGLILPWVTPGSTIVLGDSLMANAVCHQIGLTLGSLMHRGHARLVFVARGTSHTVWEVLTQNSAQAFNQFRYASLSRHVWFHLWDAFVNQTESLFSQIWGRENADDTRVRIRRLRKRAQECAEHNAKSHH